VRYGATIVGTIGYRLGYILMEHPNLLGFRNSARS
jgi:hypothetical protein